MSEGTAETAQGHHSPSLPIPNTAAPSLLLTGDCDSSSSSIVLYCDWGVLGS